VLLFGGTTLRWSRLLRPSVVRSEAIISGSRHPSAIGISSNPNLIELLARVACPGEIAFTHVGPFATCEATSVACRLILVHSAIRELVHRPKQMGDPFGQYLDYLKESNKLVEKVYSLDKSQGFAGNGSADAFEFTTQDLLLDHKCSRISGTQHGSIALPTPNWHIFDAKFALTEARLARRVVWGSTPASCVIGTQSVSVPR
jgi:hypothetical protein